MLIPGGDGTKSGEPKTFGTRFRDQVDDRRHVGWSRGHLGLCLII
jgi:hypothetical protein